MKRNIIYFALLLACCLTSCYDNGMKTYSDLDSVTFTLPNNGKTSYNVSLGDTLSIPITIDTDISKSNLSYEWEVYSNSNFVKFADGEQLNAIFGPSEYVPAPGMYTIRLHVTDTKTARQFYSSLLNIKVAGGKMGLVVLHGNDSSCDLGFITAPEFLPTEGEITETNTPNWYSRTNNERIQGKGLLVIHDYTDYTDASRCYVTALTTSGGVLTNYQGMVKTGNYSDLFYGKLNQNKPEGYAVLGELDVAFDGGEMFLCDTYMDTYFVTSALPKNTYNIAPFVFMPQNYMAQAQLICFDRNSHGFIGLSNIYGSTITYYPMTASSSIFNPADMKANLIYCDHGGMSLHNMAVMEDLNTKEKYLAELDFENEKMDNIPVAKYDMSTQADWNNAIYYAFGDNQGNMCYYATSSNVYQFYASNGTMSQASTLEYNDAPLSLDGEITMMKILKPYRLEADYDTGISPFSYYNYNKILLIGTYANGKGTLHAYMLDEISGKIENEIGSWGGYEKIIDANIKGL